MDLCLYDLITALVVIRFYDLIGLHKSRYSNFTQWALLLKKKSLQSL